MADTDTQTQTPPRPNFRNALAEDMKPFEKEASAKPAGDVAPNPNPPPTKPDPKPEPPKAAPVAAEPDLDAEILSGRRNPKGDDFKRIHGKVSELKKFNEEKDSTLKSLTAELETLRKAPKPDMAEIEKTKAELAKYQSLYNTVALEWQPEFHEKYQAKATAVTDSIKTMLPPAVADKIISVLALPESEPKRRALAELTESLDDFTKTEIAVANRELRGIMAEKNGELSKANETLSNIVKERSSKQQAQQAELQKTFDAIAAKNQDAKDGIPVFQLRDKDEAWNNAVKERVNVAKTIFSGQLDPAELAEQAHWAAAAPELLKQNMAQAQAIKELQEQVTKLIGTNPNINGGGSGGQHGGNADRGVRGSFSRRLGQELGS